MSATVVRQIDTLFNRKVKLNTTENDDNSPCSLHGSRKSVTIIEPLKRSDRNQLHWSSHSNDLKHPKPFRSSVSPAKLSPTEKNAPMTTAPTTSFSNLKKSSSPHRMSSDSLDVSHFRKRTFSNSSSKVTIFKRNS